MAEPEASVAQNAFEEYEEILEEYQHREFIDHLKGPAVSMLVHIVLVVLAFFLIVRTQKEVTSEIEISIEEMEIKEIEPKLLEELQELEELAEQVVPTVSVPDIPTEASEEVVADTDFAEEMAGADEVTDLTDILSVKPSTRALKIPGMIANRTGKARTAALRQHGGSGDTEKAVMNALRWLKKQQKGDGSWTQTQSDAMTGLALLAFLAHGETPDSEEFGMTVQKAMEYLSRKVMSTSRIGGRGYEHGIVAYALGEAYALTRLPFLKPPLEKALDVIIRGQQPDTGGWDYSYAKGKRWDLSVAGWQVQALKAGYVAGATNDGLFEAMDKSTDFLKNVCYRGGKFGYSSPGSGSWGMQGAGTLCLQLLGEGRSAEAQAGVRNIDQNRSESIEWKPDGNHGFYNWYYETQAMFHGGRTPFRKWNQNFSRVLIRNQKRDGHWEAPLPKGRDAHEYNAVYDTCLAALSLQVYYRYLPSYKMPKPTAHKQETSTIFDLGDDDLGLEIDID